MAEASEGATDLASLLRTNKVEALHATVLCGPGKYLVWTRLPEDSSSWIIKNLPYKITTEEMYDIFGKYGGIRQIRIGNAPETRGTAFVVYEDIFDAKNACDHLSGFNVCNRYLVVLYYQSTKAFQKLDKEKKRQELEKMKEKYGINKDK